MTATAPETGLNEAAPRFELPAELIAQEPATRRGDARLLLVEPGDGPVGERPVRELPGLLRRGDLLVLNESRVLPARLWTVRADTGGRVEILLLRPLSAPHTWSALARPARRLRPGQDLRLAGAEDAPLLTVTACGSDGEVTVAATADPGELAARWGAMPLPPYIRRTRGDARDTADRERYQTVFASAADGADRSVAAPTAGLHFSRGTLDALADAGVDVARVSLHVGAGTFRPPDADQIARRRLHAETFRLPGPAARQVAATRAAGGRVIAVGTTSLRVMETVARLDLPPDGGPNRRVWEDTGDPVFAGEAHREDGHWSVAGTTRLFVAPPDRVDSVDGLLTNFHLPGSSLLMLVAAVAGETAWRRAYTHAVAARMRFYSYGDCMLILSGTGGPVP